MFGPNSEVLKLVELLSKQVLVIITGRMEKTGDTILLPGQSDRANGTRILGGSESEVHPKRDTCSWFGGSKTVMTPSVKRTPTTEPLVELESERRAMLENSCGENCCTCARSEQTSCTA